MFGRFTRAACCVGLALFVSGASPRQAVRRLPGIPAGAAYRVIDLESGRTIAASREDLLRTPVLPGSVLKIATLVAALESQVIGPDTRIACPHDVVVAGHSLACSHAQVGRPLGPAEALALSCNGYFAAVAGRLRRESLDAALRQLGLPASSPAVPVPAAALGIEGTRIPAEQLLAALTRVAVTATTIPVDVRRVVIEGLRGAADYGTASAFKDRGLTALAKTGTAPMPGGGHEGLLVALVPASTPTRGIVVMAPGAAGMDAARIAVDVLQASQPAKASAASPDSLIRVGRTRRDGGVDVVAMPLEEYVGRVVSAEAAPGSGLEARRALAIVARTFVLRNRERHGARSAGLEAGGSGEKSFDVCDLSHCQVVGQRTPGGDEAAGTTAGLVLLAGGGLAQVFYHASCGGQSERGVDVWPAMANLPYLSSQPEPECAVDRWQAEVRARDLERALAGAGRKGGSLRGMVIAERSLSGRVALLHLDGPAPSEITGEEFRLAVGRALGWNLIKSSLFDIQRTALGYRFTGRGRGHGVGLCVAGSARLAAAGRQATEILARYFPGTSIATRPGAAVASASASAKPPEPRLDIILPAEEERERPRVETVIRMSIRQFAASIPVAAPLRLTVVFHPTVESYGRATRQPWWTSGAASLSRVDLIPADILRRRGTLEETLRHELAHVMTADRLYGRPIWVKEAIAMRLAAEGRITQPPAEGASHSAPSHCPSDAEWGAIRSAAALERAYKLAAGCLASQLAAGRRWDEIQ